MFLLYKTDHMAWLDVGFARDGLPYKDIERYVIQLPPDFDPAKVSDEF